MIVGIDEVGRGAWAGPLVVGAVLLGGVEIDGLTDSKKLTKKQREQLDQEIRRHARGIGLGWVSAKQIDKIGLSEALKLASRRALAHIRHDYNEIIIDGTIKLIDDPRVTLMKKADLLVPSVSAASIVAKVARDNYMKHIDVVFEGYKFASHVGYGTATHRDSIEKLGVTPLHRLSFAPLKKYAVGSSNAQQAPSSSSKTTRHIGNESEDAAARFLWQQGHNIIDRNWKTKYCEIDIVSRHGDTVYFTEVKHRTSKKQGDGIAAITNAKKRQMQFAAEMYLSAHKLHNLNARLAVVSTSGNSYKVENFLEIV